MSNSLSIKVFKIFYAFDIAIKQKPNDDEIETLPVDSEGRMRTWKWAINTVEKSKHTEMGVRLDRLKNPSVYYKGRMGNEDMWFCCKVLNLLSNKVE